MGVGKEMIPFCYCFLYFILCSLEFFHVDQKAEFVGEASHPNSSTDQIANSLEYPLWLAGESQAVDDADENGLHDSLLCKEIFYPCAPLYDSGLNPGPVIGFSHNMNGMPGDHNAPCGIADLENLELDTPPDFQLAVSFTSSYSIQLNFTDI